MVPRAQTIAAQVLAARAAQALALAWQAQPAPQALRRMGQAGCQAVMPAVVAWRAAVSPVAAEPQRWAAVALAAMAGRQCQ